MAASKVSLRNIDHLFDVTPGLTSSYCSMGDCTLISCVGGFTCKTTKVLITIYGKLYTVNCI